MTKTEREKKTGRPKGSKDSEAVKRKKKEIKIIELATKEVPVADIARVVQVSESTVRREIKKFEKWFKELPHVPDYETHKKDLFSAAELATLKSMMKQEKLDKASFNNLAYGFQQLHNAGRLEKGQSTANVSTNVTQHVKVSADKHKN